MLFKNDFNLRPDGLVGSLRGRGLSGVIIAAAREAEDGADAAQAVGGVAMDVTD